MLNVKTITNTEMLMFTSTMRVDYLKKIFSHYGFYVLVFLLLTPSYQAKAQSFDAIEVQQLSFQSKGVSLAGTLFKPQQPHAALVIVHGSGQTTRRNEFAELLAKRGISVFTYDKRGVGESDGLYAGPEVGTNNIDSANLNLLAEDASAALNLLKQYNQNIPVGLLGFSQAGWIIPIAANKNSSVDFMVLFSCPLITSLEQLRFQFYTNGRADFWENHSEAEAREHIRNDPDRYQFIGTDPKVALRTLSIPGFWIFGSQDIQVPVGLCLEHLNELKVQGKPFEYALFSNLGHNTAFTDDTMPVEMVIQWIKQKAFSIQKNK